MNDILWFTGAVIAIIFAYQAFAKPGAIVLRVASNSIIGGFLLWGTNLLGGLVGFQVGLNPVSAIVVGTLGVPGMIGLSLIRLILG
jgi:inhibitor of the pro-sigma K processing machinery